MAKILKIETGTVDVVVTSEYESEEAATKDAEPTKVDAKVSDLYIYGVYPSNYPNLTTVLEQAKDHTKNIIKETKKEIALFDDPMDQYDLTDQDNLEVIKDDTN